MIMVIRRRMSAGERLLYNALFWRRLIRPTCGDPPLYWTCCQLTFYYFYYWSHLTFWKAQLGTLLCRKMSSGPNVERKRTRIEDCCFFGILWAHYANGATSVETTIENIYIFTCDPAAQNTKEQQWEKQKARWMVMMRAASIFQESFCLIDDRRALVTLLLLPFCCPFIIMMMMTTMMLTTTMMLIVMMMMTGQLWSPFTLTLSLLWLLCIDWPIKSKS